jgi:predicted RNA-binding protein YlqC (UPF0109 family)
MEKDQEFVEYVVKALVDNPEKVKVSRTVDEMGVLINLAVDSSDMGKVIGKEGRTAKSIRTLLRVLGAKNNARVNLKIEEPEGGRQDRPERPLESSSLDSAPAKPLESARGEPAEEQAEPVEPVEKPKAKKQAPAPTEEEGPVTELV